MRAGQNEGGKEGRDSDENERDDVSRCREKNSYPLRLNHASSKKSLTTLIWPAS